jgi:putative transposase
VPAATSANRNSARLRQYDYTSSGAYFVTVCAYKREHFFGDVFEGEMRTTEIGNIILEAWNAIPKHFSRVRIDAFVVMPNHVHGVVWIDPTSHNESPSIVGARHASPLRHGNFSSVQKELAVSKDRLASDIIPGVRPQSLGAIVGSFKSAVTKNIRVRVNNPHLMVWQRNYYERVIRNERELNAVREYIIHNPVNWQHDLEARTDLELHELAFASLEVVA